MISSDYPHALNGEQLAQFDRDGFLVVRNLLRPEVLESVYDVFGRVVDTLARRWLDRGLISDTLATLPLDDRYLGLLKSSRKIPVHGSWRRILVSRPVFELWQRPELLGPVRSLIGDELFAHQAWNGRPRDPLGRTGRVHWHQDAYYYKGWDPADGRLISAWIPLVPVDAGSSCMQFVAGSHTRGWIDTGLSPAGEFVVAESEADPASVRTAVMDPGDVVFFTDTTLHQSTTNSSDRVRWSIDIRFAPAVPGIMRKSPRGYRCFSAEDPSRVEDFATWARRYDYGPAELAAELTQFESVDPGVVASLLKVPDVDVF